MVIFLRSPTVCLPGAPANEMSILTTLQRSLGRSPRLCTLALRVHAAARNLGQVCRPTPHP